MYVICSLLRTATGSLFVAYLVPFVYHTWIAQRRSAGSGVYEIGLGEMGLGELGLGELGLGEMGLGEMGGHRSIVDPYSARIVYRSVIAIVHPAILVCQCQVSQCPPL